VLALLDGLEWQWSAAATVQGLDLLEAAVSRDRREWAYARLTLATWGCRADAEVAAARLPALLGRCADASPWRHAVEQCAELVALRLQMRKEILP
jgi:hypothetical protein